MLALDFTVHDELPMPPRELAVRIASAQEQMLKHDTTAGRTTAVPRGTSGASSGQASRGGVNVASSVSAGSSGSLPARVRLSNGAAPRGLCQGHHKRSLQSSKIKFQTMHLVTYQWSVSPNFVLS